MKQHQVAHQNRLDENSHNRRENNMDIINFTFRLLKHGSIFLLKLVGIALGIAGSAIAKAPKPSGDEENEWHGIPNIDAVEHPMWEETYGPGRRPW